MKVLHVCSNYANKLYHLLYEELDNLGVEQKVYVPAKIGSVQTASQRKEADYAECYHNSDRLFFQHKEWKILRDYAVRYDFESLDVVHAHTLFTDGWLALWTKRRYRTPYIVAVRNTDVNLFLKMRPWLRGTGLDILSEAREIVFLSESYQKSVIAEYVPSEVQGTILEKSHVIPNGISHVFLDSPPEKLVSPDGRHIRLVQTGDIDCNKNQLGVLAAKRVLESRGYEVSYLVIGKTRDKKVRQRLEKEHHVEVREYVPQEQLIQAYRDADVFVMPSKHETFGLAYIEAMSQGLPVVYTTGQGIDGYFDEGEVGYSALYGDSTDLANKIEMAYCKFASISPNAVAQAAAFDWPTIASRYVSLYENRA